MSNPSESLRGMIRAVETVGSLSSYCKTQRKECLDLARKMKLLTPLLEELGEINSSILEKAQFSIANLYKAICYVKKLLKTCCFGSKIFLAFESEAIMSRFYVGYDKLNHAMEEVPCEELGISEEVKEQVELMRIQLKRAKKRSNTQDMELAMDMMVVFSKDDNRNADSAILERLAKKLELHTIAELKAETIAVKKLVKEKATQNRESTQRIVDLLERFKNIAGFEGQNLLEGNTVSPKVLQKCPSLIVPHEFLCPISLELMTDPVIVATGQTYERESIETWLNSDHKTCPKSGQILAHSSLLPNCALRNLIQEWSEKNNYELPKKRIHEGFDTSASLIVDEISSLVQDLSSLDQNIQRNAIMKIRFLSKENPEYRTLIASIGGIPPLIQLLSYPDSDIQEQTVTALLNLSLFEANKRLIARGGAISSIIEILCKGTDEARENSAATLFSLSMLDENKIMIGSLNGIPPLVNLLRNGTIRGKRDAATALFNLSLNPLNKLKAIKAGIICPLLQLLENKNLEMVDEALSILLLLLSHPEGRNDIGKLEFIETLVEIMRDGTPKNKECATALLLELGLQNSSFVLAALQYGVYEYLTEIARSGTSRAQRKANSLLQHMSNCEHIPRS